MQPDFSASSDAPLLLRPAMHQIVADLITNHQALLRQLVHALGSPLNVMLPDVLAPNVDSFHHVFTKHAVKGRIFFAHKPTQSDSLLRQLATLRQVDADVASLAELQHALSSGFAGSRLQATGPKSAEFLTLCLLHNVIINVDSLDELQQLRAIHTRPGFPASKVKVLLRLCGFDKSPLAKASRFGILPQEREKAFKILQASKDKLELLGFSFHIDSISLQERLVAIADCVQVIDTAIDLGFSPTVVDIGGGFKINYLAHEADWHSYSSALKQGVLGQRSSLTWHNASFGLRAEGGRLHGTFNTYGYYENRPGAFFLDDLLASQLPGHDGTTVAQFFRDNMIELWAEPGLALLDQAGFTIARVNGIRQTSDGHPLIMLGMKRSDVVAMDAEPFVDPVVLYAAPPLVAETRVSAFFAGNLCLETDMVYRHLTHLARLPDTGDLVVFPNTAGYRMDFSASNTIMQPTARKVAVRQGQDQNFIWTLDEQYWPT